MIKINLLSGSASKKSSTNVKDIFASLGSSLVTSSEPGATADVIIKVALFLVWPLGLYGYNAWEINDRASQKEFKKAELSRTQQEVTRLTPEKNAIEKFEEDKKQLQTRINTIKTLSSQRLRSVKALDAIQNTIPPKAWLTKLVFNDNKVTLNGAALEDTDISEFMQNLEENIYFSNVNLVSSEEKPSPDGGMMKIFVIESMLEKL